MDVSRRNAAIVLSPAKHHAARSAWSPASPRTSTGARSTTYVRSVRHHHRAPNDATASRHTCGSPHARPSRRMSQSESRTWTSTSIDGSKMPTGVAIGPDRVPTQHVGTPPAPPSHSAFVDGGAHGTEPRPRRCMEQSTRRRWARGRARPSRRRTALRARTRDRTASGRQAPRGSHGLGEARPEEGREGRLTLEPVARCTQRANQHTKHHAARSAFAERAA